jgi:translocation and assembly module TamA
VPVDVNLTLAKRSVYTAGLSYGSESGLGCGGLERRYINARAQAGHPAGLGAEAQACPLYRIPAFRWLDGWYGRWRSFCDEQTDYIDLRNVKLRASRSGQLDRNWTLIASLNMLRERWRYYSDGDATHQFTSEVCPEISADRGGGRPPVPAQGASATPACAAGCRASARTPTSPSCSARCAGSCPSATATV